MQQKIGLASLVTLIAMLVALAAWGGSPPATSETAALSGAIAQDSRAGSR